MVKVFEWTNPVFGKVFKQISEAFVKFMPDVEWVDDPKKADYVILEFVGGEEYEIAYTIPNSKRIVFQQCFLTAGVNPDLQQQLWKDSHMVMSFHNLPELTGGGTFPFYHTPLGADPDIFKPDNKFPRFRPIFTTGHVAETEHIRDIYEAVQKAGIKMYHTGEDFNWNPAHYVHMEYMPLYGLASVLNQTQYVAGLRDIEGFEVHCIQGAMCGATPVVLDVPTYDWYKDFAVRLHPDTVQEQLYLLLREDYNTFKLTDNQVKYVREFFSWQRIMKEMRYSIF